jgi:hypothetical protein
MLTWLGRLLGGGLSPIDAAVEVVGPLPPASPRSGRRAVLYRVLAPRDLAGKYGAEGTSLSPGEIDGRRGARFRIRRPWKWRHLLTAVPPLAASASGEDDFFASAIPVPGE